MRVALGLAFAAFLFVGAWLAVGEDWLRGEPAAGPPRFEWILDGRKVPVEVRGVEGAYEYRVLGGGHEDEGWIPGDRFQSLVLAETARQSERHVVLRFFNASSWASFVWVLVGLTGQLCFFGRMFLQWLASERASASVVPPVFWWLSLFGGVCLLSYFVWRLDPIGVLGQSTGVAVYLRNLWLIRGPQRAARSAESMARASASSRSNAA